MASSSTARQASSLDGICGTVNTTEDVPLREHRERHPIDQLGWQSAGFYAFGNGVLANGTWYPVDEYGIVRLPELGNQYLPALSTINKHDNQLYQFERSFVHRNPQVRLHALDIGDSASSSAV